MTIIWCMQVPAEWRLSLMVLLFLNTCQNTRVVWGHWGFCAPTIIKNSHKNCPHNHPSLRGVNGTFTNSLFPNSLECWLELWDTWSRVTWREKIIHWGLQPPQSLEYDCSKHILGIVLTWILNVNLNQLGGDSGWDKSTGCEWQDQTVVAARSAQP